MLKLIRTNISNLEELLTKQRDILNDNNIIFNEVKSLKSNFEELAIPLEKLKESSFAVTNQKFTIRQQRFDKIRETNDLIFDSITRANRQNIPISYDLGTKCLVARIMSKFVLKHTGRRVNPDDMVDYLKWLLHIKKHTRISKLFNVDLRAYQSPSITVSKDEIVTML